MLSQQHSRPRPNPQHQLPGSYLANCAERQRINLEFVFGKLSSAVDDIITEVQEGAEPPLRYPVDLCTMDVTILQGDHVRLDHDVRSNFAGG